MKRLQKTMAILFIAVTGAFPSYSQDFIAMDERLDTNFDQYATFGWASKVKTADAENFLNDAILKSTIREAVQHELNARGYDMAASNPDLLVNFLIFEKPTEFQGYTGYTEVIGHDEVRDEDQVRTYYLREGTLLVQLIDKEEGSVVWQGYASGILDDKNMFDKNPEVVKYAIEQIFERFDYKSLNTK